MKNITLPPFDNIIFHYLSNKYEITFFALNIQKNLVFIKIRKPWWQRLFAGTKTINNKIVKQDYIKVLEIKQEILELVFGIPLELKFEILSSQEVDEKIDKFLKLKCFI